MVALRELWPKAVDNLTRWHVAARRIARAGITWLGPLRPAFAGFGAAYRVSGRFVACLDALKDDLADRVGDRCGRRCGLPAMSAPPTSA
jgi:tight adherence protein B